MRPIDADALNVRSYCRWFDDSDDVRVVERMIREAPTITPPPNPPLTLDELREMGGEPVWVVQGGCKPSWALVRVTWTVTMLIFNDGKMAAAEFAMLEKGCKFYRRKPKEGAT